MTDKHFWKLIETLKWDGNDDRCAGELKELITCGLIPEPQEFYNKYMGLVKKINNETNNRIDADKDSFEGYVNYGSDDCHFIDLPGELIGRGKREVDKYLSGQLVPYEARECFTYMFQGLLSDGVIRHD